MISFLSRMVPLPKKYIIKKMLRSCTRNAPSTLKAMKQLSSCSNKVMMMTQQQNFHRSTLSNVSDRESGWEKQHRERMAKQEQMWKEAPEKLVRYFIEGKFLKNWNRGKILTTVVLLFCLGWGYDKMSGQHGVAAGIYQVLNGPKKKQEEVQPEQASEPEPVKEESILDRIDPVRMRQYAYLDVEHVDSRFESNAVKGRIVIGLYDKVVPATSFNFAKLCESKQLKDTIFHRVINKFMIQGGDIKQGTGMSSTPVLGNYDGVQEDLKKQINDLLIKDQLGNVVSFKDENFNLKCSEPYLVCMANRGPDTNGSQFFITTVATPHLNDKHVVFGKVLKGMEIVDELQKVRTSTRDKPIDSIKIVDCGLLSIDDLLK